MSMTELSPFDRGEPLPKRFRRDSYEPFPAGIDSGLDNSGKLRMADAPPAAPVNLTDLETALTRDRLDEIAKLVRALTYGEMMELAEAIWKVKPESDITQDALPMMLHRWSTGSLRAAGIETEG